MNGGDSLRQLRWGGGDANVSDGARPARPHGSLATRIVRSVQRFLARLAQRKDFDTAKELLAYARSIEHDMPNLAAELRFIATNRPGAVD